MRKKLSYNILTLLLLCSLTAGSQNIRFTHLWNHTDISFDLNQLYNYNNYEHNRWGAGFNLTTPLHYDTRYGTNFQNLFYASVNVGYGTGDQAWKYGADLQLRFPRYIFRQFSVSFHHDLEKIGGHSFKAYNILNTTENSTYFSSRYSAIDRLAAGIQLDLPGKSFLSAEYRHSGERLLFNAVNLLYPAKYEEDAQPKNYFDEAHLSLTYGDDWLFDLLLGKVHIKGAGPLGGNESYNSFWRLVAQYSHTFSFKDKGGSFSLFAQAGTTGSSDVPISRRFDISGTGGTFYYFRNTLLTVRPNTFMADGFFQGSLSYCFGFNLWNLKRSKPRPFLQLNALWGMLYGKDEKIYDLQSGQLIGMNPTYAGLPSAIRLDAPTEGLLEPVVGFENLIRWGVLDIGVAAAYQLTPKNAFYHLDNFLDKFAVMCIAKLVFEYDL